MAETAPAAPNPQPPTAPPEPPKPAPEKPGTPPPAEDKVTLTKAELEQQKAEAVNAAEQRAAEKARKEKADADAATAKEQGKFKELLDKSEAEVRALKSNALRVEVRDRIRDKLAADHPEYVGAEKYILPLVEFDADTAPEELTKRLGAAVAAFVKDNPRTKPAGGLTVPAATQRAKADPNKGTDQPNGNGAARMAEFSPVVRGM
jgi:hypothetical protein